MVHIYKSTILSLQVSDEIPVIDIDRDSLETKEEEEEEGLEPEVSESVFSISRRE